MMETHGQTSSSVYIRPNISSARAICKTARVAVIRGVDFADGLFLNGDTLHRLNRNYSGHSDAVSCFDGQSRLAADRLAGVPGVGGLELRRVSDLVFKFPGGGVRS